MSDQGNVVQDGEAFLEELRLFCCLMLGSTDDADGMIREIYRCALDHQGNQGDWSSERVRPFGIAADICGTALERCNNRSLGPARHGLLT
jgi:hypothetical protein